MRYRKKFYVVPGSKVDLNEVDAVFTDKWFRNLPISKIVVETLESLHMSFPEPTVNMAEIASKYHVMAEQAGVPDSGPSAFQLFTKAELQSVMFLQIVLGGHFLFYNTRTAGWVFLPPFPSFSLNAALWATNILAILMCAYGWLVPTLSWTAIGWVLAYTLAWVFLMGIIKRATYAVADHGAGWQAKHWRFVHQPLGAYDTTASAVSASASSS